jgi:CheY-like chemotaxis protein
MKNKILVVDDDRRNVQAITDQLLSLGYDVESAGDGYEALESIIFDPPQLILIDVFIPDLSGPELSEKLRQIPDICNIPVIAMSGYHEFGHGQLRKDLFADDFIGKPFRITEVISKIEQLLKTM